MWLIRIYEGTDYLVLCWLLQYKKLQLQQHTTLRTTNSELRKIEYEKVGTEAQNTFYVDRSH